MESPSINDDERAERDTWLEELALHEPVSSYRHNRTGQDNADANMKGNGMEREEWRSPAF